VDEGKWERERAPGAAVGSAVVQGEGCGRQWPLALGHGRWRCCANRVERRGVGDVVQRDGQVGPGDNGARWQRAGYVREKSGAVRRWGADWWARATQCWGAV
jgi:hypothetical protein